MFLCACPLLVAVHVVVSSLLRNNRAGQSPTAFLSAWAFLPGIFLCSKYPEGLNVALGCGLGWSLHIKYYSGRVKALIIRVVFIRDLTSGEWNVSGRKKFGVLQLSADQILQQLYFTGKTLFCKDTLRKIGRNIRGHSTVKPTAFVDMLILVTISKKHGWTSLGFAISDIYGYISDI